jgi:hypothetical protein
MEKVKFMYYKVKINNKIVQVLEVFPRDIIECPVYKNITIFPSFINNVYEAIDTIRILPHDEVYIHPDCNNRIEAIKEIRISGSRVIIKTKDKR